MDGASFDSGAWPGSSHWDIHGGLDLIRIFVILAMLCSKLDLSYSARDRTHAPHHQKLKVLTTGLPGKSQVLILNQPPLWKAAVVND